MLLLYCVLKYSKKYNQFLALISRVLNCCLFGNLLDDCKISVEIIVLLNKLLKYLRINNIDWKYSKLLQNIALINYQDFSLKPVVLISVHLHQVKMYLTLKTSIFKTR